MLNKYFKFTLIFLILAELFSIFAWGLPQFNLICFSVILAITLVLSLIKLEYGIYLAFTELIIGSHGYLFSFELGNTLISIRLGIFIILILAWLIHVFSHGGLTPYFNQLKEFKFSQYYLYLALVLVWGFVWGLIRGNDFGNIFLDFNNWLFFLYLLPLLSVVKLKDFWPDFSQVALAALAWLIIKTLILLYIFSHQFIWALPELYTWVRDTRIGEITMVSSNFYRVFIQSQVFALLGFFILLPFLKFKLNRHFFLILGCLTTVIISFSRSFWLGLIAGLFIYFLYLLIYQRKRFIPQTLHLVALAAISLFIIFTIINLPPSISGDSLASLISQRTTQIEAAGSSRINMLKPLRDAIIRHPVIGSGFGTTVTYISVDPRILSITAAASGQYTTYAFEWSYLDFILKVGLFGLVIYLLLIFKILQALYINLSSPLSLGLFLALISLLALNIFTPYLNHPLGIGFILLVSVYNPKNYAA